MKTNTHRKIYKYKKNCISYVISSSYIWMESNNKIFIVKSYGTGVCICKMWVGCGWVGGGIVEKNIYI